MCTRAASANDLDRTANLIGIVYIITTLNIVSTITIDANEHDREEEVKKDPRRFYTYIYTYIFHLFLPTPLPVLQARLMLDLPAAQGNRRSVAVDRDFNKFSVVHGVHQIHVVR